MKGMAMTVPEGSLRKSGSTPEAHRDRLTIIVALVVIALVASITLDVTRSPEAVAVVVTPILLVLGVR